MMSSELDVDVKNLDFGFGGELILKDLNITLPLCSRCLLVGGNGAGKSTLLRLLAGKRLSKGDVKVIGLNPFDETVPGIAYLGTEWAANPMVKRDVPVARLLKTLGASNHPERVSELLELLDVNPNWNMLNLSDGERRRVQIVLGLMAPFRILLLDEVTVDLDVIVRANLLRFLTLETSRRKCSIIYATHIFDGLGGFPTHVAHISGGVMKKVVDVATIGAFPELESERARTDLPTSLVDNSPLLRVVERWLRQDYDERKALEKENAGKEKPKTKWEVLSDNMRSYGDKYYDYWSATPNSMPEKV